MNFDNKNILITGASSGIGNALAMELSTINCNLFILSRRKELLDNLLNHNNRAAIYTYKCDVGNKGEVTKTFNEIITQFGKIDIAILNAGFGQEIQVENFDSRWAEATFGANVFGIIYWVEQLLPDFLKRKTGMIIGVSSLADNRGFSGSGFYCASKAAASIFLEGLRVDLKPHNIKVITVKPGFVKTPMTDKNKFKMPFLMTPEKAAKIILNGIKKEKSIIQFPLPTVILTKIVGLLPSKIYELLAVKTKK